MSSSLASLGPLSSPWSPAKAAGWKEEGEDRECSPGEVSVLSKVTSHQTGFVSSLHKAFSLWLSSMGTSPISFSNLPAGQAVLSHT